jgi:hypothetical protein
MTGDSKNTHQTPPFSESGYRPDPPQRDEKQPTQPHDRHPYHETFAQLHKTGHYVIPAKAGIQETIDNTGFRVALRLHGMTK